MPHSNRPGEELGGRYRLVDLLSESTGGRFWRAHDRVLSRHVAIHVIPSDDERAPGLLEAARSSAAVQDRRVLRVLDADQRDGHVYVVNEWGSGTSLDLLLGEGPLGPRRAAWVVAEAAEAVATAHAAGIAHGRLVPENVLVDHGGNVRLIGLAVDAALHGLPPGRTVDDVRDLGGLLYAGLTGRWAGSARSSVEPAPLDGDRVLRPRRVRAGIPRALDHLCDDLLNDGPAGSAPRHGHRAASAADLTALLRDFVGDPIGLSASFATPHVASRGGDPGPRAEEPAEEPAERPAAAAPPAGAEEPTRVVPVVPDLPGDPAPDAGRPDAGGPDAGPDPAATTSTTGHRPTDAPTQAGVPIFHDDTDDVDWLRARTEKPPPPPPFEDPPERPLFAPDPPPGVPVRRSRPGVPTGPVGDEYWPWGDATGTGAGMPAPVLDEPDPAPEHVPGRRWLGVAGLVAVAVLALLAAVFAFGLGRGEPAVDPQPDADTSTSAPSTAPPEPVTGLTADDLDPQGDQQVENSDLVGLAVDDDPASAWRTSTYEQQLGPAGLKTGVGLVVDLGAEVAPRQVDVAVLGGETSVQLYLADEPPTDVAGLEVLAEQRGSDRIRFELDGGSTGRYLVVWLVELPDVGDGFRGEVADVTVRQ